MSWAAHDPEGWSRVCYDAICRAVGWAWDIDDVYGFLELVEQTDTKAWDALMKIAMPHLGGAEADYHLRRVGGLD